MMPAGEVVHAFEYGRIGAFHRARYRISSVRAAADRGAGSATSLGRVAGPAAPHPSLPASITSSWSFNEKACSANVSGSGLSLDITASGAELSIVVYTLRRVPLRENAGVRIAFAGRSGDWIMTGRLAHSRQIAAVIPLNEDAVSRVLVLLSGGSIRIGNGRAGLPTGNRFLTPVNQEEAGSSALRIGSFSEKLRPAPSGSPRAKWFASMPR